MTANKRKKNTRQRGSKTHGAGIGSKHNKGAGNRGGRGMAGSGKRADTKKPSLWKERYFGKFGFKMKGIKEEIKPVNIYFLEEHLEGWLADKSISRENDACVLDLSTLGYNKLLGEGKSNHKMIIKTKYASKISIEKIKNNGGEVILTSKKEAKD